MKTFEKVFIIMIMIGLILKLFALPGGAIVIGFSIVILSIFYFFFSFALLNNMTLRQLFKKKSYGNTSVLHIIFSIYCGWAFSAFLVGVMVKILNLENGKLLFWNGMIYIAICLIITIVKYFKDHTIFYKSILIRILLFICLISC